MKTIEHQIGKTLADEHGGGFGFVCIWRKEGDALDDGSNHARRYSVKEFLSKPELVLRHFDLALSKAWEERTAPMVFTASSCTGTSAIFDGQDDHTGEHLTYKRSAERC